MCEAVELVRVFWFIKLRPDNRPILRKFERTLHIRVNSYDLQSWGLFWLYITTREPRTAELGQYIP